VDRAKYFQDGEKQLVIYQEILRVRVYRIPSRNHPLGGELVLTTPVFLSTQDWKWCEGKSPCLETGYIYRVIQEESAIIWEMIVCVILSKKVHMNMGPILNGYRDMVKRR